MLDLTQVACPETSSIPISKCCLPEVPKASIVPAVGISDQMYFATLRNSLVEKGRENIHLGGVGDTAAWVWGMDKVVCLAC